MHATVRDETHFILSTSVAVSDELAEFISEFLEETDDDLKHNLIVNGTQFIKSMEVMMEQKKTLRNTTKDDNDEESSDDHETLQRHQSDDNPIPNYEDIITGDKVIKPAISPYGHVLSYGTWTKILSSSTHKNRCPFTLQKMSRRSLIKLTKANYKDHKDKIKNITDDQKNLMAFV